MNGAEIIGFIAGYGAGQGLEQAALEMIHQSRRSLVGAHEGIDAPDHRYGGWRRPLADLALFGAITGMAAGAAISSHGPSVEHSQRPDVTVIADQPLESSFNGSAAIEDQLLLRFARDRSLDWHYYDANNNNVSAAQVSLKKLMSSEPYGVSTAKSFVQTALDFVDKNSPKDHSNLLSKTEAVSGAVVILDANHSLGSPANIVSEAKAGNVPIFIANVTSGSKTNLALDHELQTITTKTNGQLWSVTAKNSQQIANEMAATMKPNEVLPKRQGGNNMPYIIISALGLVATAIRFNNRRSSVSAS